jgi:hypothetical protein
LLGRRHNELHAMAERGAGKPVAAVIVNGVRCVFWRDGDVSAVPAAP